MRSFIDDLDCVKHSNDMCFQCFYEKLCGGVASVDCDTLKKNDLKNLVSKERRLIQGRS